MIRILFMGLLFIIASINQPADIISTVDSGSSLVMANISQNSGDSVEPIAVSLCCAGNDTDTVLLVAWRDNTPMPFAVEQVWFATLTTADPQAWSIPLPVPASISGVIPDSLQLSMNVKDCTINLRYQAEIDSSVRWFGQTYLVREQRWTEPRYLWQTYLPIN